MIFPGQENVTANGQPSQPQFTAGALTSLAPGSPARRDSDVPFRGLQARHLPL